MRMMIALGMSIATPASAQVHAPDIEARLAFLIGDWTIEGQEKTYRETCEWFAQKAFVVCASSDSSDGSSARSILGYSKAKERFTYQNYTYTGTSRSELGYPHLERGIQYIDERMSGGKLSRITTKVEPQADGRLRFVQERSSEGGPWEKVADFFFVRRK